MITEIAQIEIRPGESAAFEAAVVQARPAFEQARGFGGLRLARSIEFPERYRLMVLWETLEDHTSHFRQSEQFKIWRGLASPFFASPPQVEHVADCDLTR